MTDLGESGLQDRADLPSASHQCRLRNTGFPVPRWWQMCGSGSTSICLVPTEDTGHGHLLSLLCKADAGLHLGVTAAPTASQLSACPGPTLFRECRSVLVPTLTLCCSSWEHRGKQLPHHPTCTTVLNRVFPSSDTFCNSMDTQTYLQFRPQLFLRRKVPKWANGLISTYSQFLLVQSCYYIHTMAIKGSFGTVTA